MESEDNVITVTSENSDETEATGNLTVGENDYVIFSPNFTDGSVDVKFLPESGSDESLPSSSGNTDVTYEGTYSGRVLSNEVITPGDYSVYITSHKADGSMTIRTINKDEFEKQNEDFEKGNEEIENIFDDLGN